MGEINIGKRLRTMEGNRDVMKCRGCIYRTEGVRCINISVDNPGWYDPNGCSAGKWLVVTAQGEQLMKYDECWPLFADRSDTY